MSRCSHWRHGGSSPLSTFRFWFYGFRFQSLSENVAAGILACRRGRHLAARKKRPPVETPAFHHDFPGGDAVPPGWKPRLYVSQDGRRCHFQTGSQVSDFCQRASRRRPHAIPAISHFPISAFRISVFQNFSLLFSSFQFPVSAFCFLLSVFAFRILPEVSP
jgi:hypothetical protein